MFSDPVTKFGVQVLKGASPADILGSDDRLGGEGLDQFDCVFRERRRLQLVDDKTANRSLAEARRGDIPNYLKIRVSADGAKVLPLRQSKHGSACLLKGMVGRAADRVWV